MISASERERSVSNVSYLFWLSHLAAFFANRLARFESFLFFNNYGLDADGIRYGDRTANLFKQIIWDDTPHNYMERRDKYPHLKIDDYYF